MENDEIKLLKVSEGEEGRLDKYLSDKLEDMTRSYLKKLISDDKAVLVNGNPAKPNYKLKPGDIIELAVPEPIELEIKAENISLDIVYEDNDMLVVNKPQGMVVHPAAGNYTGTLVNALLYHCGDSLSGINGEKRPGIVHRIDKDTSGLLLVAKNDNAHQKLSSQIKEHSLTRAYKALVHGNIKQDSGRIECILETGRTHQIRVHMSKNGHPIVGDKTYGVKKEEFNLTGQLLHAYKVGFIHPVSGEYMEFVSELPDYYMNVLDRLRNFI